MDKTYKFDVDKVQAIKEKDRALVKADPKFIRRVKVAPSALMKVGEKSNIKTTNSTNRTLQYIEMHFLLACMATKTYIKYKIFFFL